MSFIEKIKLDMYSAMKSGEKEKADTLRNLLAKLKDRQIEKRGDLSEKDGLAVIKSQVKQRKESSKIFEKANRSELAEKEKNEMAILGSYLPQMMSDDDIRSLVSSIIEDTGADSISDIGKVMPVILVRGGGRVDGKTANAIVRELLE